MEVTTDTMIIGVGNLVPDATTIDRIIAQVESGYIPASHFVSKPQTADILTIGCADKTTCEHEWWEETDMLYTSNPPQRKQVCRLCGDVQFINIMASPRLPKWKRV